MTTTTTNTPQSVVVVKTIKGNPFTGIMQPVSFGIMDWTVKTAGGGSEKRHFLNSEGIPDLLRVPIAGLQWNKTNLVDKHNIALLSKLLEKDQNPNAFKDLIVMEDLDIKAESDSLNREQSLELMNTLANAKKENNQELIFSIARMVWPEAPKNTFSVVYNFLLEKAMKDPTELTKIVRDTDFQLKVNIAKAISTGVLEKTGEGIYKYNGSVLAGSDDSLVLYLKENNDIYQAIMFKIEKPNYALGMETRILPEQNTVKVAEVSKVEDAQNPALTFMALVAKYIAAGLFEKNDSGEYLYNNIPMGKNNKEVAIFLGENSSLKEDIKTLYEDYKKL